MLTEIPPLFFACCDRDHHHYDLAKPFVSDGYLWATDAKICVRQPVEDYSPELLRGLMYQRGKLPKIESMWRTNAAGKRCTRCELPEAVWHVPCPELSRHEEMGYCEECDGEDWIHTCDPLPVGDQFLISWAVGMLRHFGVTEVWTCGDSPVLFDVGRIEGMLMPMDKKRVLERQEMKTA